MVRVFGSLPYSLVCIADVNGWVSERKDFLTWRPLQLADSDTFTLVWESQVRISAACS